MFDKKLVNEQQDSWIRNDFFQESTCIEQEAQAIALEENLMDKGQMLLNILDRGNEECFSLKGKPVKRGVATFVKCAAALMITFVGIFGMTMTSQANRVRFFYAVERIRNGNSITTMESSDQSQIYNDSLDEASSFISETLDCLVPEFVKLPRETSFVGYSIDAKRGVAIMEYTYDKTPLTLYVYKYEKNWIHNQAVDSRGVETMRLEHSAEAVTIRLEEENPNQIYSAHWICKESYYELRGAISLEELREIVKGIYMK